MREKVNYVLCWLVGCAIGDPGTYAIDLTHERLYKKLEANGKIRWCLWARPYADRSGKPPAAGYPVVVLFHGTALTSTGCASCPRLGSRHCDTLRAAEGQSTCGVQCTQGNSAHGTGGDFLTRRRLSTPC